MDYKHCSWLFLLKDICKLEDRSDNIWSHFGTLVHRYLQDVLSGVVEPKPAAKRFIRTWLKFCGIFQKQLKEQYKKGDPKEFYKPIVKSIMTIRDKFVEEFGENYEIVKIEERLKTKALENYRQRFGGFVDLFIYLKDSDRYVVIDIKTCSTNFMFKKYKDKYKDYQLVLYKIFLCRKHDIDPKKVDACFLTVERQDSKNPLQFVKITSGTRKMKNAMTWLESTLGAANRRVFLKNRTFCHAFGKTCSFYGTKYCTLPNKKQEDIVDLL